MNNKKCFVIMGYGVRTDYATGRDLDLEKTYKNIIKPAAEESGLECIRADEVIHSGTIDVPMYKHLIESEVVIADLSTNNSNAFYELGVRHALRPRTTIAIAESNFTPPFDVNHTVIHPYEHLGKDIGYEEVIRFKKELVSTIETILKNKDTDSPVYTNLKNLIPPKINRESDSDNKKHNNEPQHMLSGLISDALQKMEDNLFIEAKSILQEANQIDKKNEYLLQKLALATYKSEYPNKLDSLKEALSVLEHLNINQTTNPETLGLAGAIYKRLWEESNLYKYLDDSIKYYEKGFYIKNDYYNGINLAYLYNIKAYNEQEKNQRITDFITANRIREKVIFICNNLYKTDNFFERSDKYWIIATLEEAYFAIGSQEKYKHFKSEAESLTSDNWKRKSTNNQISKLKTLIENTKLQ
ncbi:TRAFs-binding domain-containing protein [Staphylococcus saprophyticus]|nr:TRAFs-binding domain-containing protein [Staphylococcus saprophyticus]